MDLDVEYTFNVSEVTAPDYKSAQSIISWLKGNMESLTDDNQEAIFGRVNYGYNNETLKGFGKRPVCDVYIDHYNYDSDLQLNTPSSVTSMIISYLKGNMNTSYVKACELADYLIQEFNETTSYRELDGVVRDTYIRNVQLEIIPSQKSYGVLVAFELEHQLY